MLSQMWRKQKAKQEEKLGRELAGSQERNRTLDAQVRTESISKESNAPVNLISKA